MKNVIKIFAAISVLAAAVASCNKLEVTLPKGPEGEQGLQGKAGKDGLSSYELWVAAVEGKSIQDWPGGTSIQEYFIYLKGKDGADGHDGIDGKDGRDGRDGADGRDGTDGKGAYDLWVEYVATGVENPKDHGTFWEKDKTSVKDFFDFLSGNDGVDGLDGKDGTDGMSAYELWVADVTSEKGLENPLNGVYDPEEYPRWPVDAVSREDFYEYLSGRPGSDGEPAAKSAADTIYSERVDGSKYNVAPVIAFSSTKHGMESYEYVNPFSGGAAFIVTGPGPVIIPGCEVTFTSMDGSKVYTKTSDDAGYVYLTRDELPEWYDGAPSAADDPGDISSGTSPLSFAYGGRTISDKGRIASTCKVPYRVRLEMEVKGASLRKDYVLPEYEVHRVVEGVREEAVFIRKNSSKVVENSAGYGYVHKAAPAFKYYRNQGAVNRLKSLYSVAPSLGEGMPSQSSGDETLLDYFSSISNLSADEIPCFRRTVGKENFSSPTFGDGSYPSVVGVYETFVSVNGGRASVKKLRPDYGLSLSDPVRTVHVPYLSKLPDKITNASYVWKNGHTTLKFELDWDAIGKTDVADIYSGSWVGDRFVFTYKKFKDLTNRPGTLFSSFRAVGKFNGSRIDSKVGISWEKEIIFTDIYDDFKVAVSDVESSGVYFVGVEGKFSYDAGTDDEHGRGKAFLLGQEILKTNAGVQ